MKENYSQIPTNVKSANAEHSWPLLWGIRNSAAVARKGLRMRRTPCGCFLINSLPFALLWLAADVSVFAAAFGTFLFCLIYGLRQNYCRNRRLSEMARQLAAAVSERSELTDGDSIHKNSESSKEQRNG